MYYLGIITKQDDGKFKGYFPQFPECIFSGNTQEDVYQNGKVVIFRHFDDLCNKEEFIPAPLPPDEHFNKVKGVENEVCVMFDIDVGLFDQSITRINITLPENLINHIDFTVKHQGGYSSRSDFIKQACFVELNKGK